MFNAYSGTTGVVQTQLYLSGGGSPNYNWHYLAITYTDGYDASDFYTLSSNLLGYDESRVSTNEFEGWFWYDGVAGSGVAAGGPTFYSLDFGKGYNFYLSVSTTLTLGTTPPYYIGSALGSSLATVNTSYGGSSVNLTQY